MYHKIALTHGAPPNMHGTPVSQIHSGLNAISSQTTSCALSGTLSYPPPIFQTQAQQELQPGPLNMPPQNPLILVIDDSQTVRKILEVCLSREGFRVKSFPDGVEAMRWIIEDRSHTPDLIWLDIGLPKMDGYEVARHMKSKPRFNNTIIVMLSRRDGMIDRLKGKLAGAKAYLYKPFTTQDIIKVTQFYLGLAPSEQETLHQPSVALA